MKIVLPDFVSRREWTVSAEILPGLHMWNKVGQKAVNVKAFQESYQQMKYVGREEVGLWFLIYAVFQMCRLLFKAELRQAAT